MNAYVPFSRAFVANMPWLHHGSRSYTGAEIERESARHAAWLLSQGLVPGDRVMAQVEDGPQALFLYFGALRAGCVFVPLSTAWRNSDLEFFLKNAEPRLVICHPEAHAYVTDLSRQLPSPPAVFSLNGDRGSLVTSLPAGIVSPEVAECGDDDAALILYSAGTTARPHASLLTHGLLRANAAAVAELWRLGRDDTLIAALPLFSVHGLCAALHPALAGGAQLTLAPADAPALVAGFARGTVLVADPAAYASLLDEATLGKKACKSMRLFICTAAHLPPATATAFGERSGHVPRQCYGSSEAGIITAHAADGDFRVDSAGRPLPGTKLRIVGANLKPMPLEHQGEIQLPELPRPWRAMREETQTPDGWFRTGDIGMWDEHGYIVVVGRAPDVIASGYYKIYPEDVEHALEALPGVAEAAVIGLPHPERGQATHAFVVRSDGSRVSETELQAALRQRLAHYQIPDSLRFVTSLPRNSVGRLQKGRLRQTLTAQDAAD